MSGTSFICRFLLSLQTAQAALTFSWFAMGNRFARNLVTHLFMSAARIAMYSGIP